MAGDRKPTIDVIEAGELDWRGRSSLGARTKQYNPHGRLLADPPTRPQTSRVDVVLNALYPPEGEALAREQLPDTALHLEVCNYMRDHWQELFPKVRFHPKKLPSLESVLRSEKVGRKKRR
jgi:hypothetical protein